VFAAALSAGWNQIGDPFPTAVPVSTLTSAGVPLSANSIVSSTLYRYDTGAGAYVALNPVADTLQPYVGYWIYAQSSATLSIPLPQP
jgi:hypothetical protein